MEKKSKQLEPLPGGFSPQAFFLPSSHTVHSPYTCAPRGILSLPPSLRPFVVFPRLLLSSSPSRAFHARLRLLLFSGLFIRPLCSLSSSSAVSRQFGVSSMAEVIVGSLALGLCAHEISRHFEARRRDAEETKAKDERMREIEECELRFLLVFRL